LTGRSFVEQAKEAGALRIGRVGLVAVIAAAVGLCCAALALAAPAPGLDPSYGDGGSLPIEPPPPAGYQSIYPEGTAVAPGGAAYALLSASKCSFPCAESGLFLYRYLPNGSLDGSFGGEGGAVQLPPGARSSRLGVDARGRPLVVRGVAGGFQVLRYTASGRPDSTFGSGGAVSVLRPGWGLVRAVAAPGGRILLVGNAPGPEGEGEFDGTESRAHRIGLVRLLPDGGLDRSFGRRGAITVDLPGGFDTGLAFAPNGAILIGGVGCCGDPITITRLSPRGLLDTRFDAVAARSLRRLAGFGGSEIGDEANLRAVVAHPGGGIDLLGGDGVGGGFVLRLHADGHLATKFGQRGLRQLPKPVDRAVAAPGGGTFAIGSAQGGLFAMRLLLGGRLDPGFGGGQPMQLPSSGYATELTRAGAGRVVVSSTLERECRLFCAPLPILTRLIEPTPRQGRR
jgi:uncharacterized delta-60 repeat protein